MFIPESRVPKGQVISKGIVGILNSSKKQTKKFDLQYYDTLGPLFFVFWKKRGHPKFLSKIPDL